MPFLPLLDTTRLCFRPNYCLVIEGCPLQYQQKSTLFLRDTNVLVAFLELILFKIGILVLNVHFHSNIGDCLHFLENILADLDF